MWQLATEDEYLKQRKWYEKKRLRELAAAEANLKRYLMALQAGAKPQQVVGKWIHTEKAGVRAVDQSGFGKGKLAQTRLYTFADVDTTLLHAITLGDKQSQPADVRYCEQWVRSLQDAKVAAQSSAGKDQPPKGTEESEPDG